MRDRMERLVILPFSVGCVSQSSVAVGGKKMKQEPNTPSTSEEQSLSGGKMKNSFGLLPFQKPNFSFGLQRLIKGFKSFSQLFVYKEVEDDEEMEIGFPTDVKHVTHVGWDGSTTTNTTIKGWDDLKAPELLSLTPITLRQFELAMAAQSDASLFH